MKYYIKLDENNIVRDIISFPWGDYIEITYNKPLPPSVHGGWYKWEDKKFIEIPELKPKEITLEGLEQENLELKLALAEQAEHNALEN